MSSAVFERWRRRTRKSYQYVNGAAPSVLFDAGYAEAMNDLATFFAGPLGRLMLAKAFTNRGKARAIKARNQRIANRVRRLS